MKKGLKFILAGAAGALPFVAFAQDTKNLVDIINIISGIVNTLIPFIIGLAILVIIWGVFGYITGAGDEEKRGEAKQYIIWGIIGVFVMLSIWGLIQIVSNTLGISRTATTEFPGVPLSTALIGRACTIGGQAGTFVADTTSASGVKCQK